MNLNDLASFVHVVEFGTITAAAAAEGVPKSTISRRITRLESALGVELLRRSARSFTLTDDGRQLHARSTQALQALMDAEQAIMESSDIPRGRLIVTAPPDLGGSIFPELFATYRARYPEVSVELRLEEKVVDLIAEGVDVGMRGHTGSIPGSSQLMSYTFGHFLGLFYASHDYLRRRGEPKTLAALKEHDMIIHPAMKVQSIQLDGKDGTQGQIDFLNPAFQVNDFMFAQALAEAGSGIALLPHHGVMERKVPSPLKPILTNWSIRSGKLSLVWPVSRHLAPRVRAFVDLAKELIQSKPWLAGLE